MKLRAILEGLRSFAPEYLAEQWDHVGLHLGRMDQPIHRGLLCIDLTEAVVREARSIEADLVVAYHPPIFQPLTCVTDEHVKSRIVLDLAQAGIAVYSPHTALDAAVNGVNDWLATGVGPGSIRPIKQSEHDETAGQGRLIELDEPIDLATLVARIKLWLDVEHLEVADPGETRAGLRQIGVCAGAGGALLAEVVDIDAFITGEMRHHDVLAAVAEGTAIILAGHTQTERPYLPTYRQYLREITGDAIDWRLSKSDKAPSSIR